MSRTNPEYVLVKLADPVGADDAQHLAQHIAQELAFADIESARPAYSDGFGRIVSTGTEVPVS